MTTRGRREGLKAARFLMVLGSISPLFVLWAIRGNSLLPDRYFLGFCAAIVVLPNAFLYLRMKTAIRLRERRELVVGKAEDHREHLLVYLFAMLLPFYAADFNTWRVLAAALAALGFIVFLFWHLNLHYMNLLFAALGYRVFTLHPSDEKGQLGRTSLVLITRRVAVPAAARLVAYRLSDTVYFEVDE